MRVLIPVWCNWNTNACAISIVSGWVLIPVWCNWNGRVFKGGMKLERFNSCMVQLKFHNILVPVPIVVVLIPVWCNWNNIMGISASTAEQCFNSCMVQLKLTHDPNWADGAVVLIPVWCNWNNSGKELLLGYDRFNSCMVQLKSTLASAAKKDVPCFNSCMVQLKWMSLSRKSWTR